MRFLLLAMIVFCGDLPASESGSNWSWHKQFPWVFSDAEQTWQYWRAGSDGNFYHWKSSDQSWYRFDESLETWLPVNDSGSNYAKEESARQETITTGILQLSLNHDGLTREYLLYVPSSYDGSEKLPLVFNFHGFGGDDFWHLSAANMTGIANQQNFFVIYPQGSLIEGYSHWNAAAPSSENKSSADDLGFVDAMISSVSSGYELDTDRIYACGYSNGGMFSYYLACQRSDKIAAIGSVAGTMLEDSYETGQPTRPVPMINLHGTADYVVPYTGGSGFTPISDVLNFWVEKNGANPIPTISNLTSGSSTIVENSVYSDSNGTSWVEHFKVVGGGHDWLDLDLNGSDTNSLLWDFFNRFDLNGPRRAP